APGIIALATPDGSVRQVADGLAFPNGMLITDDGGTLIVAKSYAKRLTAFDLEPGGSLSNRRGGASPPGRRARRGRRCRPWRGPGTATRGPGAAPAFAKAARCSRRSNSIAAAAHAPSAAGTGGP